MDTDISHPDQPIDVALMLDRCMDDASLALMVLKKFEEQTAETLAGMLRYASLESSGATADEASRRAHALRGTAGAIGANGLMDAATRLEEAAHAGMIAQTRELAAGVAEELRRCLSVMPAVIQELESRAAKG